MLSLTACDLLGIANLRGGGLVASSGVGGAAWRAERRARNGIVAVGCICIAMGCRDALSTVTMLLRVGKLPGTACLLLDATTLMISGSGTRNHVLIGAIPAIVSDWRRRIADISTCRWLFIRVPAVWPYDVLLLLDCAFLHSHWRHFPP